MRVLLAVPVYNERDNVAAVVAEARRYIPEVLVVDDGSTDGTSELIRGMDGIRILCHPSNLGYGQSLIDAFGCAERECFDWIITMDCDGQHEPATLPEFLQAIAADDCDIVSGSRYLPGCEQHGSPPADRRTINEQMTRLINTALDMKLTDAFCGFKACRVNAVAKLDLTEPGYAMPMQFWVQASRHELRIRELPVRLIYNDPSRSFGGPLDDPAIRKHHYAAVFQQALACTRPRPDSGARHAHRSTHCSC